MFNPDELIAEVSQKMTKRIMLTFDKRMIDKDRLLARLSQRYDIEVGVSESGETIEIALRKELL